MIRDIYGYLDTQFSWLVVPPTADFNFFMMSMPPEPDFAVCVYYYSGGSPMETMGDPTKWVKPRLQVMVRNTSPLDAEGYIKDIYYYLAAVVEKQIGNTYFHKITPVGTWAPLGYDNEERARLVANFETSITGG